MDTLAFTRRFLDGPASCAVAILAGKYKVTFSYEPAGFRRVLVTSTVPLLLVLAALGTYLFTQLMKQTLESH